MKEGHEKLQGTLYFMTNQCKYYFMFRETVKQKRLKISLLYLETMKVAQLKETQTQSMANR